MEARGRIWFLWITVMCAVVFLALIFKNSIRADSPEEILDRTNIKVNLGGRNQNFVLEKVKNNDVTIFNLVNRNFFQVSDRLPLEGFEDSVSLCPDPVVKLGQGLGEAICLQGDVGVHSRNLVLVKAKDGKFLSIIFSNSEGTNKFIVSDVPNFEFKDYNNDGLIDLFVDNRNYDTDPLTQSLRDYYRGTGDGFNFDREENIQYHNK